MPQSIGDTYAREFAKAHDITWYLGQGMPLEFAEQRVALDAAAQAGDRAAIYRIKAEMEAQWDAIGANPLPEDEDIHAAGRYMWEHSEIGELAMAAIGMHPLRASV